MPRGGTPPPPTAATTLSDGPIELPISPPSPVQFEIQNAFGNPLPSLSLYPYIDHHGGNANPEPANIGFTDHGPRGPGGRFLERLGRLGRKRRFWALMAILLTIVTCTIVGLTVVWQKGDKGKISNSSSTSISRTSATQPPRPPTSGFTLNSATSSDPPGGTTTPTTTPTKRITTVTSTIRATQTPSAYTTFPLWIGTFDSLSPLVSSSGICQTSTGTSTTILQECAENARFTTIIGELKPYGYAISTTPWTFSNSLVPTNRSGKQWYYTGNSTEKKYPHASSPGCEVVEKAGLWLGAEGTYVLEVNYESTNVCTLNSGRAKNPTAQVCECVYEGVFATTS
ncbi:hypothetical protein HOY80DRAFT_1038872 [Tuber brumale]|nr:hypothetical protein HOY80DRAFT_1038872 [Tuber brumale]